MKKILKIKEKKGFVILFAVVVSSIVLTITMGVANIALKEVKFSTSARDSNYAFYAADTGAECALVNDKTPSYFPLPGSPTALACANGSTPTYDTPTQTYRFIVTGLGSTTTSCSIVTVKKDDYTSPPNILTTIIAKGYNIGDSSCTSTNPDRIEREIRVTY